MTGEERIIEMDYSFNNIIYLKMEHNIFKEFKGHYLFSFLLFAISDKYDERIISLSYFTHHGTDFDNDINIQEIHDINKAEKKIYKMKKMESQFF